VFRRLSSGRSKKVKIWLPTDPFASKRDKRAAVPGGGANCAHSDKDRRRTPPDHDKKEPPKSRRLEVY